MLRSSLGGVLDRSGEVLEKAHLDPTARAEDLSPADWLRLAKAS